MGPPGFLKCFPGQLGRMICEGIFPGNLNILGNILETLGSFLGLEEFCRDLPGKLVASENHLGKLGTLGSFLALVEFSRDLLEKLLASENHLEKLGT